jgi:hypothetical protein
VFYRGIASQLNLGVSRSTASRFFSGRPTSLAVTLRILAALHLRFEMAAAALLAVVTAPAGRRRARKAADAVAEPPGS